MSVAEEVALAAVESNEKFREALKQALDKLGISIVQFSCASGVSQSTLYKIISQARELNLRTVRQIVQAMDRLERREGKPCIAVIASRPFLNEITRTTVKIAGKKLVVQEYPANSIEEAIIAAVRAERDGARAVVCAPIVSSTVEKILRVPIVIIMSKGGVEEAIKAAAKKVF